MTTTLRLCTAVDCPERDTDRPAVAAHGSRICVACSERRREKKRAEQRSCMKRRRESGVCAYCQSKRMPDRTVCAEHLLKVRDYHRARRKGELAARKRYGSARDVVVLASASAEEDACALALLAHRAVSGCEERPPLWVLALRSRGELWVYEQGRGSGKRESGRWRCFARD